MEKTIEEMIKEDCEKAIANAILSQIKTIEENLDTRIELMKTDFKFRPIRVNKI